MMEHLENILPYIISAITAIAGWIGGRRKTKAELEGMNADNAEKLLKLNNQFIVEPLTKEINVLSKKITKLEKAINRVGDCPHSLVCPVRDELQKHEDNKRDQ